MIDLTRYSVGLALAVAAGPFSTVGAISHTGRDGDGLKHLERVS